jgi:signal transduction histidine kinase/CheY-like chemotaxis protein
MFNLLLCCLQSSTMPIKSLFILIAFFSFLMPAPAQTLPDSLWSIWSDETQAIVTRLEALKSMGQDKYGMRLKTANPDTLYYHAQLMYNLAQANGLEKWVGEALMKKGVFFFSKNDFTKAIEYFAQGRTIGEAIGDEKLTAGNSFSIGICNSKLRDFANGLPAYTQALEIYQALGEKRMEAITLDNMAVMHMFVKDAKTNEDVKTALGYVNRSLAIREELIKVDDNDQDRFVINAMKKTIKDLNEQLKNIPKTTNSNTQTSKENEEELLPSSDPIYLESLGNAALKNGDNDKALDYFFKALKESEAIDNISLIASNSLNIGNVYRIQGNINQALDYFIRSRKKFNEIGNDWEQAKLQIYIGDIYANQGGHKEALAVFSENLAYYKKIGDKPSTAGMLSSIGQIYRKQGDLNRALENYKEALKINEEKQFLEGVAGVSREIGSIYYDQGDFPLALEYLFKSLNIFKKSGFKRGVLLAEGGIASVYAAQGKHTQALAFGTKALAASQQSGNVAHIMESSKTLNISYKAIGDYEKALEMNELYFQMRDSLNRKENQKAVIQLQIQSDYEKRKAIDDLENEKRVAVETQKKENQQKLSIAIGIGLLLISFLALVIFNRLKVTRQQKAIIEAQKKKVEQSEKYKEQFLANMSHEIRTPMHAISGMTNILVRKEHLSHQEKFLQAIKQSSRNLLVILNDILDLSKIEAGKIDIQRIPMNPREVVLNVSDLLRVKAEEKGLPLHTDLAADIPEYIYGDPTRLNQILLNLLGNAIKFTQKGSVSLSVTADGDNLRFAVRDSGIGIPADRLDNIFKSFEQVNDSITRNHGGTGLGLTITEQLIGLQNGRIWVKSQENIGSTFFFELPLLPVEADKKIQDQITDDQLKEMAAALSGLKILVVEDDELNTIIAQEDLEYYLDDVTIGFAGNGQEAVQQFEAGNYDLILMDIQMPELNGYEATRAIRKIEVANAIEHPIRIIAMTASLLKSEIDNCYAAGMDNYIPKPYKMEELIGGMYCVQPKRKNE